jgi:hypothetical protein
MPPADPTPGAPTPRRHFARVVLPGVAREHPRALLEALAGPGSTPFLARLWTESGAGRVVAPVGLRARCLPVERDRFLATVSLPVPVEPGDDAWVLVSFRRRRGLRAVLGKSIEARCHVVESAGERGVLRAIGGAGGEPREVALDEVSLRAAAARAGL